jgi:ABC-type branched-subunit amino acid transport system permease subunit
MNVALAELWVAFSPVFGLALDSLTDIGIWTSIGIFAGTYTLFALGLQLNVGFTGIVNFGQAGFMAVGAYAMAILVVNAGFSFWLAMPIAVLIAMVFGLLVGLPSLRLRADYFAITTIAAAEIVRLTAQNARGLTGGTRASSAMSRTPFATTTRGTASPTRSRAGSSLQAGATPRPCSRSCSWSGPWR